MIAKDDGTIIFHKRETPPELPGYRRKSKDPHSYEWRVFIPEYRFCKLREPRDVPRDDCPTCLKRIYVCSKGGECAGCDSPLL